MEKPPRMHTQDFRHAEGRETTVAYEKKELLSSSGEYGDIYRVEARFPDEEGAKKREFVVKEFKSEHPEQDAQAAFEIYQKIRDAGARTWPTYRIGDDGRSILMTEGGSGGSYLFGFNNDSKSKTELREKGINHITNLEEALSSAAQDARRCAEAGLYLPYDPWFCQLALDDEGNATISFFIGDFDKIEDYSPGHRHEKDLTQAQLLKSDEGSMRMAVYWMLKDILGTERATPLMNAILGAGA